MTITRRQMMIGGGTALGLGLAGGLGYFLFGGGDDETGTNYSTNTEEVEGTSFGHKDFNAKNSVLRLPRGREILFFDGKGIEVHVLNPATNAYDKPLPQNSFPYLGIERANSLETADPTTGKLIYGTRTGEVLAFVPTSRTFLKTDLQARVNHVSDEELIGRVPESEFDAKLIRLGGEEIAYSVHSTGDIMLVTDTLFSVNHARGGLIDYVPGENGMIYREVPAKIDPTRFGRRPASRISVPRTSD